MTAVRIEELEGQLETARRRAEEAEARAIRTEQRLEQLSVETAVRDAAAKSAVPINPAALTDVIRRASQAGEWKEIIGRGLVKMEGGLPALDANGHDLTPARWLVLLKADAPHLFADADTGAATGKNPFSKDGWNLTEQGRIARENPTLAKQLAQAAGRTLNEV